VTPAGELVRATPEEHADLFWAPRGGGGSFGVVTALEFRLFPYGEVYAGMFLFPFERAPEVLRSWRDWTETEPEEITTSMRLLHLPPLPELPDFLRGRSVAVIDEAFAGDAAAGAEAVAALRALGPELDTWAMAPAVALSRLHMDPEEPMPHVGHSTVLGPLDDAALDAFAAHAQPGAPPVRRAAPARGRAGARAGGAGATGSFEFDYLYLSAGPAFEPAMGRPCTRQASACSRRSPRTRPGPRTSTSRARGRPVSVLQRRHVRAPARDPRRRRPARRDGLEPRHPAA
jgi:hypothetical protein